LKTSLDFKDPIYSSEHNHELKTEKDIVVSEFRKQCKKRAAEDLFERPAKLMMREVGKLPEDNDLDMRDVVYVRYAMWNERKNHMPKQPKNRIETHEYVSQCGLLSEHKEDMVQLNDSENEIIILAAPSNLHLLCNPTVTILGDGTFKTCLRFFTQLYILHVFKNSVYVPCVFSLLPSKSEDIYHKMFLAVHFMCAQQGLHLDVTSIHLDFELATHKAVLKIWPMFLSRDVSFIFHRPGSKEQQSWTVSGISTT
jgi:hypothetical protein